jgi:hypothetical protein
MIKSRVKNFPDDLSQLIEHVKEVSYELLDKDLLSIYVMGSLGYADYIPNWSDVDIDVIISENRSDITELNGVSKRIRELVKRKSNMNVVVKCYPLWILNNHEINHEYGIACRSVMLLDTAIHVFGKDIRSLITRPSIEILRLEAINVLENMLKKSDDWWKNSSSDDLAGLLSLPARLIVTCESGKVISKRIALELLLNNFKNELPKECYLWNIWALCCRFSKSSQEFPSELHQEITSATIHQLDWCLHRFRKIYAAT